MIENNAKATIKVSRAIHKNMEATIQETIKLIKKASAHSGANISWLDSFEVQLRKLDKEHLTARAMDAVKWATTELNKEPAIKYIFMREVAGWTKRTFGKRIAGGNNEIMNAVVHDQAKRIAESRGLELRRAMDGKFEKTHYPECVLKEAITVLFTLLS